MPEGPAAKFWELLRRNHRFKRAVAKLAVLAKRATPEDGWQMVHDIARRNAIAAEALRWLVPCPTFVIEKGRRIGRAMTRNPDDCEAWEWFKTEESFAAAGWPQRWGPDIEDQEEIAEWRDYFGRRTFDLKTPWQDAPEGFKRALRFRWEQLPGGKLKRVQFEEWAKIKTLLAGPFTAANPKHRPDLKRRVDFMDGLVDATFPRFDFTARTRPPPH